jgi:hypothetical protein
MEETNVNQNIVAFSFYCTLVASNRKEEYGRAQVNIKMILTQETAETSE